MFFADLTPYEYGYEMPRSNVLNVGWLSRGHVFPVGAVPELFVEALRRMVKSPRTFIADITPASSVRSRR
jgi:hypothetical protein